MAKAKIIEGNITDLVFDDKNFNKGSEFGNGLMEKSFQKFAAGRGVLVDKNNRLIAGNKSTEKFGENGGKKIVIVETTGDTLVVTKRTDIDLDSEQGREMALADNATAKANIVFDAELVEVELSEAVCVEWGIDVPKEEHEAAEDDFNGVAPKEPITVLGDLYEINDHRLLCGDSTCSEQVAKLMNGEKADMVFTDPPYGVSYQSNMRIKTDKFDVLENDNVFITEWINNLPLFSNGFVFVWTSWKVLKQWIEFCEPIGELSNLIVWDKGGGGIGDLKKTFLTDFEVALVYHRGAEIKGKRLGSVWSIGKDGSTKYLHPTQKPVELPAMAIENITNQNELVLDLFLDSGSTMVASHQLKRKCYGMELDPKYCDVIVARMIKLIRGTDSSLTIKRNGQQLNDKEINKFIDNTNA